MNEKEYDLETMLLACEFGFKGHERGQNWDMTRENFLDMFKSPIPGETVQPQKKVRP